MNRTALFSSATAVTAIATAAALVIGYAIYFDYKRKQDKGLQKRIKQEKNIEAHKQKKKTAKEGKSKGNSKSKSPQNVLSSSSIIEMIPEMALSIEEIYARPPAERERIFYSLLVKGEELLSFKSDEPNLSNSYTEAAVELFFKAIKMIPNPTELLVSLRQVLPKPVFNALTKLITEDGLKRIVSYFKSIIPTNSPITIAPKKLILANGEIEQTWAIFATKDIEAGTVLYEEKPDAASLYLQYTSSGKFCDFCFKTLDLSQVACDKCRCSLYCSEACLVSARKSHHSSICGNEAFGRLLDIAKREHSEYSLLVARYLSVLCFEEKEIKEQRELSKEPLADKTTTSSHFEFMKPLLLPVLPSDDNIATCLKSLFSGISPDIFEHLDDNRYSSIKGTLLFNSIGIPLPAGFDDQVDASVESPAAKIPDFSPALSDLKENSLLQSNDNASTKSEHQNKGEKLPALAAQKDADEDESSWVDESISTSSPVIFDSPVVESISNNSSSSDDNQAEHSVGSAQSSSSISINQLLERSRSPLQKSKLIGHGLYHISAHMQHSCDPNTSLVFPHNNNFLRVFASHRIEKGDEICMSYIPLSTGMSSAARRAALKATYHIDCACILCEADLPMA